VTRTSKSIEGTFYTYESALTEAIRAIADRVGRMRQTGRLSGDVLHHIRTYFRIKNIYHSNAIEGNVLNVGETRQVVEMGLTLTGKPLKDQAEARNLSHAIDFLEELAAHPDRPILENEIRQIHQLVLKGINDDNAGRYRSVPVEISGSEFKPPSPESVPGQIEEFARWLATASIVAREAHASPEGLLHAAVAHTWFVYIHPFIDGNGRVARLLMNLILMRYGYPIAIITKEDRLRYYDALEISQSSDLSPFLSLLAECIHESLEEYERAASEQRERLEWARSLAERFSAPERIRAQNEYEVWKAAMELLKSYVRQTVELIKESTTLGRVYFRDFGALEFEKYLALRSGESAKKTWFIRLDFRLGDRTARYIFFFGYASPELRPECDVTLHVAREEPAGSFFYETLTNITSPNVPSLVEIGYKPGAERFVARYRSGGIRTGRIEEIGRNFFEEVVKLHFSN
jgi:Fic family protein